MSAVASSTGVQPSGRHPKPVLPLPRSEREPIILGLGPTFPSSASPARSLVPPPRMTEQRSGCSPRTVICRWNSGTAQTGLPAIARALTGNLSAAGAGRRALQIRPFKLPPAPQAEAGAQVEQQGRNLFVVRSLSLTEQQIIFVHDPAAPLRNDKGKQKQEDPQLDQPIQVDEPESSAPRTHSRWSYISLGATNPALTAAPFDAFLQRVLLGGAAAANNPTAGSWVPRATAVSIDSYVFLIGAQPGGVGDWEIRVGPVQLKGGSSSGATRGLVIEVSHARTVRM